MVRFLAYLAGLPHHGSPLSFPTCPQPIHPPESIDIDMRWPTSLTGGERPGGNEFGCGET